jgi:hypothetical protein
LESRVSLLKFVEYLVTSKDIRAIAFASGLVLLSDVKFEELNVTTTLRTEIYYKNIPIEYFNTYSDASAPVQGADQGGLIIDLFASVFSQTDTNYDFSFEETSQSIALANVRSGKAAAFSSNYNVQMDTLSDFLMIPVAFVSTFPTILLPAGVRATHDIPDAFIQSLNLDPLYPFKLDIDTLASIFMGEIVSWLDIRVVAFNPSLPARFAHTGESAKIYVLVCCKYDPLSDSVTTTTTDMFASTLARVSPKFANFSGLSRTTERIVSSANWTQLVIDVGAIRPTATYINFQNEEVHNQFQDLGALAGAIGYRKMDTNDVDITKTIAIVNPGNNIVYPSAEYVKACIPGVDPETALFNPQQASIAKVCYPFTVLTSYGVLKHYTAISQMGPKSNVRTQNCVMGEHSMEFLKWLVSNQDHESVMISYVLFV